MFSNKQKTLFPEMKETTSEVKSRNAFISAGTKKSAEVRSGNGALKYDSTGNAFVDQFGKLGSYKAPRPFAEISNDMAELWAKNPLMTVCLTFFMRIITRVVSFFDGTKTSTTQRGSGLKHEGIMRMIWLHIYHPDTFWKNIQLWTSAGSWRDIFEMLRYDLEYNDWSGKVLDWDKFGALIMAGLDNPNTAELVKKYMPHIKARSKCTTTESQANTIIGKWLANKIFGKDAYKEYRQLKASGKAHQWQQLISKRLFESVNFDTIHGRALSLIVSSKFITNHGLEKKYEEWISAKPVAKYTGYVHELMSGVRHSLKKYQEDTINKQFAQLVETAKKNATEGTSMIVVRDASGSMAAPATGTKESAGNIAKALALFFSEMLPAGHFANSWIEFNSSAEMHSWKGSTPVEKWRGDNSSYIGSTDFQSVIRLFAKIKSTGVAESEFPTGILCISDGEFNPAQLDRTNVEAARHALRSAGFSEDYVKNFTIVLWNLRGLAYNDTAGNKFETHGDNTGVFYFSGYDGSTIAFLTGVEGQTTVPKSADELFDAAMDQELMKKIEI